METGYIYNLCSNLGTLLEGKDGRKSFVKNNDKCEKNLKKIRKEINYDQKEEKNTTLLLLGDLGVVKNYLIPMALAYGGSDTKLLIDITKVVVQLTMPLGVSDINGKDQRLFHLQNIKSAFLIEGALQAFLQVLIDPLERLSSSGEQSEDKLLVELVLWLVRNLLAIPDGAPNNGASTKNAHFAYLHENFILMLDRECVLDVILHLGEYVGNAGNHEWNLVLLEIYYQLFRGLRPDDVFIASEQNEQHVMTTSVPLEKDDILKSKLVQSRRIQATSGVLSSRHSKFGGMIKVSNSTLGVNKMFTNAFALKQDTTRRTSQMLSNTTTKKLTRKSPHDELSTKLPQHHIFNTSVNHRRNPRVMCVLRTFLKTMVSKCYRPLYQALKQDFRREDLRLLPSDQVQFLSVASFCSGFQRIVVQTGEESTPGLFPWHECAIVETMDKWTFHFVIKSCQIYMEEKKVKELEICTLALKEMVQILNLMQLSTNEQVLKFCVGLRNSVFYDITDLEIVHRMIFEWEAQKNTWYHLATLACCAHAVLDIADHMAREGVVVKAKTKQGAIDKSNKNLTGKPWNTEEITALVEGVQIHGSDLKGFRAILRDGSLSPIFDVSRNVDMMYHRWNAIKASIKESGQTVEEYVESYVEEDSAAAGLEDEEDEEQKKKDQKRINSEKELLLEPLLRPFRSNRVVRNLCFLIDPSKIPIEMKESFVNDIQNVTFTKFCDLISENGTKPAVLWHISLLGVFGRALHEYEKKIDKQVLVNKIRALLAGFFSHAKENPLAFVEILYWRGKGENELMMHGYEDPAARQRRLREEQEEKDYEALMKLRKEQESEDESSAASSSDSDDGGRKHQKTSRKRIRTTSTSDDSEAEANFDTVEFSGRSAVKLAENTSSWTDSECTFLVEHFEETYSVFQERTFEELSNEAALQKKTIDDIRVKILQMKLMEDLPGFIPGRVKLPNAKHYLNLIEQDQSLEGFVAWFKEKVSSGTCVLVPQTVDQFSWLRNINVASFLYSLGFTRPTSYWTTSMHRLDSIQLDSMSDDEIDMDDVDLDDIVPPAYLSGDQALEKYASALDLL